MCWKSKKKWSVIYVTSIFRQMTVSLVSSRQGEIIPIPKRVFLRRIYLQFQYARWYLILLSVSALLHLSLMFDQVLDHLGESLLFYNNPDFPCCDKFDQLEWHPDKIHNAFCVFYPLVSFVWRLLDNPSSLLMIGSRLFLLPTKRLVKYIITAKLNFTNIKNTLGNR